MSHLQHPVTITKASGKQVPFDARKLRRSLMKSGASNSQAEEIVGEILKLLVDGMSTKKIYRAAFKLLKRMSRPVAARYKLKQAITDLGPSGFPFELFVAALLESDGFKTEVGSIVRGRCVNHEVDIVAEKDDLVKIVECKFHTRQGFACDVKIPLYFNSRFNDIRDAWETSEYYRGKKIRGFLVNNTRFSTDAIQYAECVGLHLIGWDYPSKSGLNRWVERSHLHPITCLTSLSKKEIEQLLDQKVVLCSTLLKQPELIKQLGIKNQRFIQVLEECSALQFAEVVNGENGNDH